MLSPYIMVPGNDVDHLTNVGMYLLEFFIHEVQAKHTSIEHVFFIIVGLFTLS